MSDTRYEAVIITEDILSLLEEHYGVQYIPYRERLEDLSKTYDVIKSDSFYVAISIDDIYSHVYQRYPEPLLTLDLDVEVGDEAFEVALHNVASDFSGGSFVLKLLVSSRDKSIEIVDIFRDYQKSGVTNPGTASNVLKINNIAILQYLQSYYMTSNAMVFRYTQSRVLDSQPFDSREFNSREFNSREFNSREFNSREFNSDAVIITDITYIVSSEPVESILDKVKYGGIEHASINDTTITLYTIDLSRGGYYREEFSFPYPEYAGHVYHGFIPLAREQGLLTT